MKSLFRGFAAFLLMSIALSASAKKVDMSDYADGEGWKQFSTVLVADGFMKSGANEFDSRGLSFPAYKNSLTPEQRASVNFDAFHRLNLMTNDLPEVISVDQFRRVAGNLKLPDVQVVAAAKTSTTPTTLVPAAAAPQVQMPPAPVVTAENVQKNLDKLSTSVDDKYSGIKRRVDELKAELSKKALKSDIAKIVEETQTIVNLTERMDKVEKRVDLVELKQLEFNSSLVKLDGQQKKTATDVAKLQVGQSSISELWLWVYGLAVVVALSLVLNFVALSKKPASPFR